MRFRLSAPLLLIVLVACSGGPPSTPAGSTASAPPPQFLGALAMPDSYSAAVVTEVLERGGNAVDAAVAAGFVLAVTFPEAGNIGGGGFMLLQFGEEEAFLDYRERAPAAAYPALYIDASGEVNRDASVVGALAAGVPGTVAGLWVAHQRFGSLPWRDLVLPAIVLAERGFSVPPQLARNVAQVSPRFEGKTNFATYFAGLEAGAILRQPELAATLRRIAVTGPEDFYRGETAALITDAMTHAGGLIGAADLEAYRTVWREPLRGRYRGFTVLTAPPPSAGGVAILQLLGIKERLDPLFAGAELNDVRHVHLFAEMQKRVFADRAAYLGDADYVDVPVAALLAPAYLDERAAGVQADAISTMPPVAAGLGESMHTTHFSIIDAQGNAVANTYTINTSFGSGMVVDGAGFLLNNEMDDFSARPGTPNFFGVVGADANAIAPGKRPLSSMSPTLLAKDGEVRMVLGAPGGSTIPGTLFQAITAIVDFGLSAEEAVAMPRFHHQYPPADQIRFAPSVPLPDATASALEAMGYQVLAFPWDFGDLQLLWRADGKWQAASDPRHRGQARILQR